MALVKKFEDWHPETKAVVDGGRRAVGAVRRSPVHIARGMHARMDAPMHAIQSASQNTADSIKYLRSIADKAPRGTKTFARATANLIAIPVAPIVFGTTAIVEGANKSMFGVSAAERKAYVDPILAARREKARANSIFRRFRKD